MGAMPKATGDRGVLSAAFYYYSNTVALLLPLCLVGHYGFRLGEQSCQALDSDVVTPKWVVPPVLATPSDGDGVTLGQGLLRGLEPATPSTLSRLRRSETYLDMNKLQNMERLARLDLAHGMFPLTIRPEIIVGACALNEDWHSWYSPPHQRGRVATLLALMMGATLVE